MAGTLYVVATPIGNLADLTHRAAEVLGQVSLIAAEDTRRTRRLLARHGLSTPTTSCHAHNEARKAPSLLRRLLGGEDLALVTDGGTPGVSDPGPWLVRRAAAEGIRIVPVPGPSAPAALLSVSGFSGDAFVFHGFLPHRQGERRRLLEAMRPDPRTQVFFESPRRIAGALRDAAMVLGERRAVLGRELTKRYEEVLRGTLPELAGIMARRGEVRGEVAVVLEGRRRGEILPARPVDELAVAFREALNEMGGDRKGAVKRAAQQVGLTRSEAYRRLQEAGEV